MHVMDLRVYYEDTDLAGIVYYANYLKFIERGRTELLREIGVAQGAFLAETGIAFAVRTIAAEYLLPARIDDLLTVETQCREIRGARIVFDQRVKRDKTLLFEAEIVVAALGANGRPARVPAKIRDALAGLILSPFDSSD